MGSGAREGGWGGVCDLLFSCVGLDKFSVRVTESLRPDYECVRRGGQLLPAAATMKNQTEMYISDSRERFEYTLRMVSRFLFSCLESHFSAN